MQRPPILYATNTSGLKIAYWTIGDPSGGVDIVWVPNFGSSADCWWMIPDLADFWHRFSRIGRVTLLDVSGLGGSDPIPLGTLPPLEQWMDDVRCVMDAEGIEKPTLMATDWAGPVALLFAATHPERVSNLILFDSFARFERADDYPAGVPGEYLQTIIDTTVAWWGTGAQFQITAPDLANDAEMREWVAFSERTSIPPSMRRPCFEMFCRIDVRDVLPSVRAPTLVLHRSGDVWIRVEHGRYLADHIAGARLVELDGNDHFPFYGDSDLVIASVREFLTGERTDEIDDDRVLATMLFTDIVDSTKRAAAMGDRRWRELLDKHDNIARQTVQRFRGRVVQMTGDGVFATFDGPARAVRCASAIRGATATIGVPIRVGLHTGEVELRGDNVGGINVHVGARVGALAQQGEILVSGTVKDLTIGSGLAFEDRGEHSLKGVPGVWRLFALSDA